MLRKNKQLIAQLRDAKAFFSDDLADMSLAKAYQKLMETDTVRGKMYHLIKPYIPHLMMGAPLINKICKSIHFLTLAFYQASGNTSKDSYIRNIHKRQRLCHDVAQIKNLNQVYYYNFSEQDTLRKATEHDVERAMSLAIHTIRNYDVI